MEKDSLLERLCSRVEKVSNLFLTVFLGCMGIVVFLEVVFRYVIKAPLSWSEELARYLMIWLTFVGGSVGIRHGSHVGAEGLRAVASPRLRTWIDLIGNAVVMVFLLLLLRFGWTHALKVGPQLSAMMRISMSWIYVSLPLGALLMIVQLANVMRKQVLGLVRKA